MAGTNAWLTVFLEQGVDWRGRKQSGPIVGRRADS